MNCENICVRSSWQYSLWLARSRDLRKPGGVRVAGVSRPHRGPSPHGLSWAPQAGRPWVQSTSPVGPSLASVCTQGLRLGSLKSGPQGELGPRSTAPQALGPQRAGQSWCISAPRLQAQRQACGWCL